MNNDNIDDYYPDIPETFLSYYTQALGNPQAFSGIRILKTLWNQIMGVPETIGADPTADDYKDWITQLVNPFDYLVLRYGNYELLYQDVLQFDRLFASRIQSNIMEFTKIVLILRSASKQYHDLLLGANGTITNENSYTGLNANGVYNITKNNSESIDTLNRITQALNTAQTEMYLFLDRIVQPLFKLIYSGNN